MIYQVMEALDVGDAVSEIARRNALLLAELGQPATILTRFPHPAVRADTRPCHDLLAAPDAGLLFHLWGYNTSTWLLPLVRGRKAVHYHNITPPEFFTRGSRLAVETARGYRQLAQVADMFDLIVGDSRFNVADFRAYTTRGQPGLHLYPIVEPAEVRAAPHHAALAGRLRREASTNLLFLGRVARNKRQDRLMRLFDYYDRHVGSSGRLWLVGNDRLDPEYRAELERLRRSLPSGERIVFTGKVPDAEMMAYLRAADALVCASEHEGFCLPIAQAMALDVPVLAYAAGAVPETMGDAGLLIHDWDLGRVAELLHLVLTDAGFREGILLAQRQSVRRFSAAQACARLTAIVAYLVSGETSPLFQHVDVQERVEHATECPA